MKDRIEEAKGERRRFSPAGQSTQMIVGADEATDETMLATSALLYDSDKLRRVYYSAFSPIPEPSAALPLKSPPLQRENRRKRASRTTLQSHPRRRRSTSCAAIGLARSQFTSPSSFARVRHGSDSCRPRDAAASDC